MLPFASLDRGLLSSLHLLDVTRGAKRAERNPVLDTTVHLWLDFCFRKAILPYSFLSSMFRLAILAHLTGLMCCLYLPVPTKTAQNYCITRNRLSAPRFHVGIQFGSQSLRAGRDPKESLNFMHLVIPEKAACAWVTWYPS